MIDNEPLSERLGSKELLDVLEFEDLLKRIDEINVSDATRAEAMRFAVIGNLVRHWLPANVTTPPDLQSAVRLIKKWRTGSSEICQPIPRPPLNAEYLLYLLLRGEEREVVVGDLVQGYGKVIERFNKRRADIWYYRQVIGSLFPLLRRALLRIGAFVWLGRILRRLIS